MVSLRRESIHGRWVVPQIHGIKPLAVCLSDKNPSVFENHFVGQYIVIVGANLQFVNPFSAAFLYKQRQYCVAVSPAPLGSGNGISDLDVYKRQDF